MLFYILFFTFLASIASLLLVSMLLLSKTLIKNLSFSLVAFAAGALLATGFLETMKEAMDLAGEKVLLWVTLSFTAFFLIERLFLSLHHHEEAGEHGFKLPTPLLIFGDALHNFIDGMSIAATFLVSFPAGVVTTVAVFAHEIPHELGDFAILIHKGWSRKKVLLFNFLSGFAAVLGAIIAFYLGMQFQAIIPVLLAITTGNFIYLSATDLLPEIHHRTEKGVAVRHSVYFVLGIATVVVLIKLLG